jgi:hypothetical protein
VTVKNRILFRIEVLHDTLPSPVGWLVNASTPALVKRLADELGCGRDELFANHGGQLWMHPALLICYLLHALPESGIPLRQLVPGDGHREQVEFKLAQFFSDEAAMAIAGSRPDDKTESI